MKDPNCAYCIQGELVAKFGYPVCEMETGVLYLFKEQSKRGRVILAYKEHVSELIDISDDERSAFFADVAKVSKACLLYTSVCLGGIFLRETRICKTCVIISALHFKHITLIILNNL